MVFGYVTDPEEANADICGKGKVRNIVDITSEDLRHMLEDSCSVNGNKASQSVTHFGVDNSCEKPSVFIEARSQYLSKNSGMSMNARKRCIRMRALTTDIFRMANSELKGSNSRVNQQSANHPHGLSSGCLRLFIDSSKGVTIGFPRQFYDMGVKFAYSITKIRWGGGIIHPLDILHHLVGLEKSFL